MGHPGDLGYCWSVGDTFALGVTYTSSHSKMSVVEGVNFSANIVWSIGGNIPTALRIIDPAAAVFVAEQEAPYAGDVFVVANNITTNQVDTLGIIITSGVASCPSANNFNIVVDSAGSNVAEGSCVYINSSPAMPQLTARTIPAMTYPIDWSLIVRYYRSGRSDDTIITVTGLPGNVPWNIYNSYGPELFGGEATIRAEIPSLQCGKDFHFSIRAKNPNQFTVESTIDQLSGYVWYCNPVARHESDSASQLRYYSQFNEVGSSACDATGVRYTPNASNTSDGGFGIFQLTKFGNPGRTPNMNELWNWRANVQSGIDWLSVLQGVANTKMQEHRGAAGTGNPVPDHQVTNIVTFSDATGRPIEDAVAIKRYNGLGSIGAIRDYCVWISDTGWVFTPMAIYENPVTQVRDTNWYVKDVCLLWINLKR
ncbi:MAG: hypothetical protein AAB305_05730 [Candidatus Zixiibacteriota bacterium]